jgi:uncharacterized protein YjbJ (UPF0337 family)
MKGKITLLAGVGIGYVLGARAGHEHYETIVETAGTAADKVRRDPRVQDAATQAQDLAKEKAAAATDATKDAAQGAAQGAQAKVGDTIHRDGSGG